MFFKKTDIIIISIIIALSVAALITYNFVFSKSAAKAQIYYNSKLIKTIELNKGIDKTFSLPQNDKVIFHLYEDGYICFEQSDCPDKVCVKSGKLHMVGESAACLPNGIILKIVPQKDHSDNDIDIVSGK